MYLKPLAVTVLSVLAANAYATTTDWGVHGDLELAAGFVEPGSFEDLITFSIPSATNVTSTTVANNLLSLLNIKNGHVALYQEAGATDTLLSEYAFDGTTGNSWHSVSGLMMGDYYYQITGKANGSMGGFYSITSSATPVPEPGTYALLLAGLGAVGFLYRRRNV